MKTLIIGALICVTVHLNAGRLSAQGGQGYFGVIVGISTLSADGRSVTTPDRSAVSLYNPMNGLALDILGGWSLNNYVSFQGNYIWNRNRLTLTSTEAFAGGAALFEQERTSSHNSVVGDFGSSAEFVGKTVFHRRLRRPRCSPSLKASLASSAAAPALTLGCAPRCRLVWAMGNGASGGGSGHRV